MAAILKTVISPYLWNRLIDLDEIWRGDAHGPLHEYVIWNFQYFARLAKKRALKFRIFENPRWRRRPSWKSQKSRYLRNGFTDLYEIWLV